MPQSHRDDKQGHREPAPAIEQRDRSTEPLEDEEKILAGRPDANIPALLTKDVPGG